MEVFWCKKLANLRSGSQKRFVFLALYGVISGLSLISGVSGRFLHFERSFIEEMFTYVFFCFAQKVTISFWNKITRMDLLNILPKIRKMK